MVISILLSGLVIVLVWLGMITFYLRRIAKNYYFFTSGVNRKSIDEVLSKIIRDIREAKTDIARISERCDIIDSNGRYHIQKIGLLRFNPFKDTGGDQSFILSLTDAHETGVVITALYSRSGTRWYAKRVIQGKGSEHQLSEEEKRTLSIAKNINQLQ